ncbi:MAG TPA: hypothetical protein VGH38_32580 [Bryobacteraceae bacterium]
MSTQKQIDANRRNARRATGPRSEAGRARAAMNALQSGLHAQSMILPGEDPAELATLITEYHDYHAPHSPEARAYCDKLARSEWLSRRFGKIEVKLFTYTINGISRPSQDSLLGEAYVRCGHHLSRLQRRMDSVDREYHRDLKMLRLLEAEEDAALEDLDPPAPEIPIQDHAQPVPPTPPANAVPPQPRLSTAQQTANTIQTTKMGSFRQSPVVLRAVDPTPAPGPDPCSSAPLFFPGPGAVARPITAGIQC